MSENNLKQDIQVNAELKTPQSNSVIGFHNGFCGDFYSDGLLRIDGDFKGTIKGKGVVLVGEKGRIVGDIYASSVRIGGKIRGSVFALNKVEILSTGILLGNLYSPKFLAEEGMIFTGQGKTMKEQDLAEIFKNNVENSQPIITNEF
jgi:cytoskeletal protein CcmA (bactofilin family)